MPRLPPGVVVFGRNGLAERTGSTPVAARANRWVAERRWAVIALLLAVPLALASLPSGTRWVGGPFPGFFVMENLVVPTVGLYSWTGMRSGLPFHARVVAMDGVPLRDSEDLYGAVAARPVGTPVRYTVVKDGESREITVATMQFTERDYWVTLGALTLTGLMSIAAGIAVFLLQPRQSATTAFLSVGVWSGLFSATASSLYDPVAPVMSRLHFVTEAMFPAAFVHFALVFPRRAAVIARRPRLLAVPYVVSTALAAWILVGFYGEPPALEPLHAAYAYAAVALAAMIASMAHGYWRSPDPAVRHQLRLVLPGLVAGTAVAIYGFANTARAGGDFPINLIGFTPFIYYLSVAWAIVRRDLFDVDRLVALGVVYVSITIGVMAVYAIGAATVAALVPPGQQTPLAVHAALLVAAALAIEPLRARVQWAVDRAYFRGSLDYRETVREVSRALTTMLDLRAILSQVGRPVADGLQLEAFHVLSWSSGEASAWRYDARRQDMVEDPLPGIDLLRQALTGDADVRTRAVVAREGDEPPLRPGAGADEAPLPQPGGDPDDEPLRQLIERLQGRLVVPLEVGGQAVGAFVLGPRRSGKPFAKDDLDLIGTLAAQTAIAVENARSYQALEDKVRDRTVALAASNRELRDAYRELEAAQTQLVHSEKMASLGVLVAGVAHEINNPVSFIVNTIEPVSEAVERIRVRVGTQDPGLVALLDRVSRMCAVIGQGAERTAGIVNDLRTFSRLGDATVHDVDLHEGLEVTIRLLHPRWADRITIHRDYGTLPPIEAAPGQLNQVFTNLLANACDAIAGRGNIWITTRESAGTVSILIKDDGAGIAPSDLPNVFDPFFTTKPQGKGTGLGLSISHGIVTGHGGRIEVTSAPGQGTTFTVSLPVCRTAAPSVAAG